MDSDALATFLAVHRARSFSAAAEALGRTQPAISRRIALLEAELGAPLFERTAGGAVLSLAGQVLAPHAERVVAALRDAGEAMAALRNPDAGPVSLAVVGTLAASGLTAVLRRFGAERPGVALTLRTATSTEVSNLVRRGEAAIGLRYRHDGSPDLISAALAPERLLVACAPDHPLAGRGVARLSELAAETWLAFPDPGDRAEPAGPGILAQFQARGVGAVRWAPVDSLTAQKRLAEAGFGIVLLPESAVREELAQGALAVIAVGDLTAVNPVFAVVRKGGYLNAAARRLFDILATEPGWT